MSQPTRQLGSSKGRPVQIRTKTALWDRADLFQFSADSFYVFWQDGTKKLHVKRVKKSEIVSIRFYQN